MGYRLENEILLGGYFGCNFSMDAVYRCKKMMQKDNFHPVETRFSGYAALVFFPAIPLRR